MNFKNPVIIIGVLVGVLALTVGVFAVVTYLTTIDGHVTILTPAQVTSNPAFVEWGDVTAGGVYTQTVDLTNHGQTATTMLEFVYTKPTDTTITCNSVSPIPAGATVPYTFTFTVGTNAPTGEATVQIEVYQGS